MKIIVRAEPNEPRLNTEFSLEDLNHTEESWSKISRDEKLKAIDIALKELEEPPYWLCEKFNEEGD